MHTHYYCSLLSYTCVYNLIIYILYIIISITLITNLRDLIIGSVINVYSSEINVFFCECSGCCLEPTRLGVRHSADGPDRASTDAAAANVSTRVLSLSRGKENVFVLSDAPARTDEVDGIINILFVYTLPSTRE